MVFWKRLQSRKSILSLAVGLGLLFWLLDSLLDYYFFYQGHGSLWQLAASDIPPHELYIRSLIMVFFVIFGLIISASTRYLKRSEERYKSIIQSSMDGYWLNDRDGNILEVNDAYCRISGYSRSELIGMNIKTIDCNYGNNSPAELITKLHATKRGRFNSTHRRKDGSTFEVEVSYNHVADSGDRIVAFLRDITQQQTSERALRESEARHKAYVDNSPLAIIVNAPTHEFVDVNPAACEITGYSKKEFLTTAPVDLVPPEDVTGVLEGFGRLKTKGRSSSERRVITKSGEILHMAMDAVVMPDGNYLTFCTDVTERHEAEARLRESEERFRYLLNKQNDAVFLHPFKEEGFNSFVEVNAAACKRYGYSREEFLRMSPVDITKESDVREHGAKDFRRMMLEKGNLVFEATHIAKSGLKIPVEISSNIVSINDSPFILSLARDITSRKEAEAKREQLEGQLRQSQKMEALGTLAGGIAHDFNNMLAVISGYAEMADEDARHGNDVLASLGEIMAASERAKSLVTRILAFSRKVDSSIAPVDLNKRVRHTVKMLRRTIPKMVKIDLDLEPELGMVSGDGLQLEQVLLNLGSNASDAMSGNGVLTIRTINQFLNEEFCAVNPGAKPGYYVCLTVSDTGHGMSSQTREHIFDPFYTTKEVGKGTGMGLAVVYGIVKSHGGYVECRSRLHRGSSFMVYLPKMAYNPGETAPPPEVRPKQNVGSGLVMIVDDEPGLRDISSKILTRSGYKTITAQSGEEAIARFRENDTKIDLVVLDLSMPGMGGHKCLDKLWEIRPDLRVLIASGYSKLDSEDSLPESDNLSYLSKPFTKAELLAKAAEMLD